MVPGKLSDDLHPKTQASILRQALHMTDYAKHAERYLMLIEGGPPSNYSAWSPDLPGSVATGETLEEVEREMREATALHLEGMEEGGEPMPEPSGPGVYVERKPRAAAQAPADRISSRQETNAV
jgi:predicted RNase H-like HicB family nuclease